jgi:hypothetical protein
VTSVKWLAVMGTLTSNSMVLLARGGSGAIVGERPRLRDRIAASFGARRLDRELAEGTSPETNVGLALRARRLTEPDRRWSIAGALRRIVRDVEANRTRRLGCVAPNSQAVEAARDELNQLADTLADPGPVAAHGVAQAWLLLTDGTGPLYNPGSCEPLSVLAAQATQQLRPWAA